jgi:hypothetical protein
MIRLRLGATAGALAVVGAVLAIVIGVSSAQQRANQANAPADLVLTKLSPATVRGRHFARRTRVQVTFRAARSFSRRARTDPSGAFTVTFPVVIDRCTSWSVSANQRRHAVVVLRGPKPECAPAGTP